MNFYEFRQNNSGGVFAVDEKVCAHVIIEAENAKEANKKAEELGIYFDGCNSGLDCSCCGDRWSEVGNWNEGHIEFPIIWNKNISFNDIDSYVRFRVQDSWLSTSPDTRIFYNNGEVKEFYKENNLPIK